MGRILEHDAKALLSRAGIAVPRGKAVGSFPDAEAVALDLGLPVMLKALVPAGRRGKSGAVVFAGTAPEAAAHAARLLGSTVGTYPVTEVLVEEALAVDQEWYLSVLLDRRRRMPVAMAGAVGGVEIEALTARDASRVRTVDLDPWAWFPPYQARDLWASVGASGRLLADLADLTHRAVRLFFDLDATLIEINPIGIRPAVRPGGAGSAGSEKPGKDTTVVALSAVISLDDNALPRHPDLRRVVQRGTERLWRPPTLLEQEGLDVAAQDPTRGTARFIQLDGDIGFLCGGGGGSLVFFDALVRAGGRPACYSEFGGNPTAEKTRGLARVVLACPGIRGLLIGHNITNNTQIDLVAQGVVAALKDRGVDPAAFPVVAREAGTREALGKVIFEEAGIEHLGEDTSMEEAARRVVVRAYGRV